MPQSWVTTIANIDIGCNACNQVDIIYGKDDNALHMVWSTQDAGSDYKTYYRRLSNDQWGSQENVTDGSSVGGFPTVSTSLNRVHVSYNTGNSSDPATNLGEAKSRDKYVNTWQASQLVYSPQSFRERIHAGGSKLFDFYYQIEPGLGQYTSILYAKNRDLNNSTWSLPIQLNYGADVYNIVSATNTSDSKTHITYTNSNIVYRNFNGTSWSSEFEIGSGFLSPKISSTSNDLFVVWGGYGIDNVYLRQYDEVPLTPSNLSIDIVNEESVLSWSANIEPDVKISGGKYKIYRAETSGGEPTSFILVATINAYNGDTPVTSWTDIESGKSYTRKLFYKISAMDKNLHESLLSDYVWRYGKIPKISTGEFSNFEYQLLENYPNPFNPSTKISYSIKEEGLVTLKVYDILGKEIATLVNENKPTGLYEAVFDASSLPSGLYIYKIQSGSFTDAKKMLLTK
jgi:hypothetical protein